MDYVTKDDLLAALAPLPTRDEMRTAISEGIRSALAPYATREEMRAELREALAAHPTREEMRQEIREEITRALAPYATRQEMREEAEQTRRHFDVVAESLTGDNRLLAEGYVGLDRKIVSVRATLDAEIAALARRVTRLEVSRE